MSLNISKFILLIVTCILMYTTCHSQAYLGYVKKEVSLLDSNNVEIEKIKRGEMVFIHSAPKKASTYHVNRISTNAEGMVPAKNVYLLEEAIENTQSAFNSIKSSDKKDPIIKVHNSTHAVIKLRIDNKKYEIQPKEDAMISLTKGKYNYVVTSADMLPHYGRETLDEFYMYEWEFYIE